MWCIPFKMQWWEANRRQSIVQEIIPARPMNNCTVAVQYATPKAIFFLLFLRMIGVVRTTTTTTTNNNIKKIGTNHCNNHNRFMSVCVPTPFFCALNHLGDGKVANVMLYRVRIHSQLCSNGYKKFFFIVGDCGIIAIASYWNVDFFASPSPSPPPHWHTLFFFSIGSFV